MTESTQALDQAYALLFGVRRSVRYHMHRRRFYEAWNTSTVLVSLIGSSSAILILFSMSGNEVLVASSISALVAVVNALDFAVGTGRRSNEHSDLARQFISLEAKFPSEDVELSAGEIDLLRRERLSIESREPPVMRLLDAMCHYELLRAMGDERAHPRVPLRRRVLIHFLSQAVFARDLQLHST